MYFSTCLILLLTVLGIVFYYLRKQQEEDDGEHKNLSLSSSLDQQSPHEEEHDQRKDSSASLAGLGRYTKIKGTFGYMDAEYYATHRVTRKSDVYAFGVVLLEVLCGRPALDFTLDEQQHSLSVWAKQCIREGKIDRIVDPCLRGQTTANCLKEFGRIACECILTRSEDRPTMTKVVARLEFVLALASQKQGAMTIAEKVWSLFSIPGKLGF
ncbi:hypothetical protein L2E82_07769 [Cichorium intybus]|uniref:Uncharacterized protein n=1 Tax=Cichorium intybus TaxID=13427 RepID=A0ACB9G5X6_CICIN|nr:hypothetical protein L2E82_07769 [Cichorium intybus]